MLGEGPCGQDVQCQRRGGADGQCGGHVQPDQDREVLQRPGDRQPERLRVGRGHEADDPDRRHSHGAVPPRQADGERNARDSRQADADPLAEVLDDVGKRHRAPHRAGQLGADERGRVPIEVAGKEARQPRQREDDGGQRDDDEAPERCPPLRPACAAVHQPPRADRDDEEHEHDVVRERESGDDDRGRDHPPHRPPPAERIVVGGQPARFARREHRHAERGRQHHLSRQLRVAAPRQVRAGHRAEAADDDGCRDAGPAAAREERRQAGDGQRLEDHQRLADDDHRAVNLDAGEGGDGRDDAVEAEVVAERRERRERQPVGREAVVADEEVGDHRVVDAVGPDRDGDGACRVPAGDELDEEDEDEGEGRGGRRPEGPGPRDHRSQQYDPPRHRPDPNPNRRRPQVHHRHHRQPYPRRHPYPRHDIARPRPAHAQQRQTWRDRDQDGRGDGDGSGERCWHQRSSPRSPARCVHAASSASSPKRSRMSPARTRIGKRRWWWS